MQPLRYPRLAGKPLPSVVAFHSIPAASGRLTVHTYVRNFADACQEFLQADAARGAAPLER